MDQNIYRKMSNIAKLAVLNAVIWGLFFILAFGSSLIMDFGKTGISENTPLQIAAKTDKTYLGDSTPSEEAGPIPPKLTENIEAKILPKKISAITKNTAGGNDIVIVEPESTEKSEGDAAPGDNAELKIIEAPSSAQPENSKTSGEAAETAKGPVATTINNGITAPTYSVSGSSPDTSSSTGGDSSTVPSADFTVSPVTGSIPLTVNFTDRSSPYSGTITEWLWDFGDGAESTEQNPTYVYNTAGTYTVTLKVTGSGGQNTKVTANCITVISPPIASFSVAPEEGPVPLTASFTNSSTGSITTYLWDFGDGTTSTERIPSHIYTQSGIYDITLDVSGPGGSDSTTLSKCITAFSSGNIIQGLLDSAPEGGTVTLGKGIYKLSSNLSIKKNVTLKGLTANSTILVLGPYNILIKDSLYMDKNEAYYQLYDNLTDVTLENLTITGYTGVSPQGPIEAYVRNYLTLKNCKLVGNKGTRVSGIYYGGTYLWTDATKTALWKTGGVKLDNTLVAGNITEEGHGYDGPYSPDGTDANGKVIYWSKRAVIYANGGKMEVYNSTIAGNLNNSSPAKKVRYGALLLTTARLTMENSIMWNNGLDKNDIYLYGSGRVGNATYSDVEQESVTGEGVINEDPLFDEGTYTISDISPCKGTGKDGVDMGAK